MTYLPLANILHHRLRSALSAAGVGIAVCMFISLAGLARGTVREVADRWKGIDAQLIVYPAAFGNNITTLSGAQMTRADLDRIRHLDLGSGPVVERVAPIYANRGLLGKTEHMIYGVDPAVAGVIMPGGKVAAGRMFDREGKFAAWLNQRLAPTTNPDELVDISESELAEHGGLEMLVDQRLAKAQKLQLGDTLHIAGHTFIIVGIAPDGTLGRMIIPLATAQYIFQGKDRHSLEFVQLKSGVDPEAVAEHLRTNTHLLAVQPNAYGRMLDNTLSVMYVYINIVNSITLSVAFLFILVTLYMMVLQHQREIAILRSMGASRRRIVRQVVEESLILTALGVLLGVALCPLVGWGIQKAAPFYVVQIEWSYVLIAIAAALVGGTLAALYPAWRAAKLDMVEALSAE